MLYHKRPLAKRVSVLTKTLEQEEVTLVSDDNILTSHLADGFVAMIEKQTTSRSFICIAYPVGR